MGIRCHHAKRRLTKPFRIVFQGWMSWVLPRTGPNQACRGVQNKSENEHSDQRNQLEISKSTVIFYLCTKRGYTIEIYTDKINGECIFVCESW